MTNHKASLLSRAWRALVAFEQAIDPSAEDYVLARLNGLENELRSLKTEIERKAST